MLKSSRFDKSSILPHNHIFTDVNTSLFHLLHTNIAAQSFLRKKFVFFPTSNVEQCWVMSSHLISTFLQNLTTLTPTPLSPTLNPPSLILDIFERVLYFWKCGKFWLKFHPASSVSTNSHKLISEVPPSPYSRILQRSSQYGVFFLI